MAYATIDQQVSGERRRRVFGVSQSAVILLDGILFWARQRSRFVASFLHSTFRSTHAGGAASPDALAPQIVKA